MIIPTENPPAKLVNRLNKGNRQTSSLVRFMPGIGYFRVSVIGLRYFDRGAGGFMGGGAWIFEGRVVCSAYPEEIEDALRIPTVKSKAGWGYQGMVSGPSGQSASVEDKASTKHQIQSLNQEFWSLDEALAYANGDDGGLLANSSEPVSISRTKDGYRLKRKTQENSMPKETIRISCDGAPGPGLAWTIVVEFRPLSRGYSVWAYQNNIMTDKPKWKRVESSKQPLTWRAAYQSLVANDNLRVFGDFWFETEFSGLSEWQANILRLAFIVDEDGPYDYRSLGDLLVGFADDEIQSVVPTAGLNPFEKPFSEDEEDQCVFQKLASLASSAVTAGLIGRTLNEIREALAVGPEVSLDDLDVMLWREAESIKHALEQKRISEFIDGTGAHGASDSTPKSSPQDRDYSRLHEWQSISEGPLPDDMDRHLDLIVCWLSENPKPWGGGDPTVSIHESSEWPILKWLLDSKSDRLATILSALLRKKPEEAKHFTDELMRRGKREAYCFEGPGRFSGRADNVIGRHVRGAHVKFALRFQAAADSLGIPIEESCRIGELPYLPLPKA